jgi:hypothetical protein
MSKKTALQSADSELKYHLVNKYRELISRRYDDVIKNIDKAPVKLDPKVASDLKDFFLENIYPDTDQRRKLDVAFAELGNFVHNPSLVWGLLGSLPRAIFQFGSQLPAAIMAGLKSLEAYTSAIAFENSLLQAALDKGYKDPISDEQFINCLKSIPEKSLVTFINQVSILFTTISNATLLSKTILIMEDVIQRMKGKSELYSTHQIEAIQLGLDMMKGGYTLLEPYDDKTKAQIISFVASTEGDFIASLHD